MPIGYVPNNFIGGYARISGWRSWNEAKRTEMEFLLGDLSKGDFLHVDVPRVAKVPFGELVEQGIIPPGAVLTDKKERFKATVKIDGSLKIDNISGSIHQVGAKVQGLPSCNGWDFWHIKNKSSFTLLDNVRDKYRNKKTPIN